MKKLIEMVIRLLFPPKCIFCSTILDIQTEIDICGKCHKSLGYIGNKLYLVNKFSYKDLEPCKYFNRVFCVFEYSGYVKEAIVRYKYFGKAHYHKTFARLLADILSNKKVANIFQNINHEPHESNDELNYKHDPKTGYNADYRTDSIPDFDMIISVPLHKTRERKRGYNQAHLISKELSRIMQLPEGSDLLIRTKNTSPQSLLNRYEKSSNVTNAFKVIDVNKIEGKKILLIDDVLTTGNTVNECSRVLIEAGAVRVDIAVIAVAFVFDL